MPRNQFVVPQFLDVEAKIIGPITARQFMIMLGTLLVEFVIYRVFLNLGAILLLGIPTLAIGIVFSFVKVNGLPFHFITLNMLQTVRRPALRVWDKTLNDADLRVYLKKDEKPAPPPPPRKAPIERSRLNELTLVVNTGGVYASDEEV